MPSVAISSVIAADRIGPGMDITAHTSAGTSAGDLFFLDVSIAGVARIAATVSKSVAQAAGARNPVMTIGWDAFASLFFDPNLPGIADGATVLLQVQWFTGSGTFVASGTLSTTWDPNSFTWGLFRFGLADNTALLLQILSRVTNNLPSLP